MQHMKRYVKLLTTLLAGAFLATACYEDKGNYDYSTTGDDILVYRMDTMKNVRLTWSYDEEIVIEPGYRILHDRVSESDLAYEWSIDEESEGESPAPPVEGPAAHSAEARLAELQRLYDQHLITSREFEEKRQEILRDL